MNYTYSQLVGKIMQHLGRYPNEYDRRLTPDQMLGYVETTQRFIAQRANLLGYQLFKDTFRGTLGNTYDLDQPEPALREVEWVGFALNDGVTPSTLRELKPHEIKRYLVTTNFASSIPDRYFISGSKLQLYPSPISDVVNGIYLYAIPHPRRLLNDDDVSDLSREADDFVCIKCAIDIASGLLSRQEGIMQTIQSSLLRWRMDYPTFERVNRNNNTNESPRIGDLANRYLTAIALS